MDLARFSRPDGHRFHQLIATPSAACDWFGQVAGQAKTTVRLVRGRKSATSASFFDEAAAALQFPYYFGDNWDSLHDCVADLTWLRAHAVVLGVTDAELLLAKDKAGFDKLALVLKEVTSGTIVAGRPVLHVVLQTDAVHEANVRAAWHACRIELERIGK